MSGPGKHGLRAEFTEQSINQQLSWRACSKGSGSHRRSLTRWLAYGKGCLSYRDDELATRAAGGESQLEDSVMSRSILMLIQAGNSGCGLCDYQRLWKAERTTRLVLNKIQGPEKVKVDRESRPPCPGNKGACARTSGIKVGLRSFPGKGRQGDDADIQAMSEQPEEWGVCRGLWEWVTVASFSEVQRPHCDCSTLLLHSTPPTAHWTALPLVTPGLKAASASLLLIFGCRLLCWI